MAVPASHLTPAERALFEQSLTRRAIALAVLRPLGVVIATLVVYALVPIRAENALVISLFGGLSLCAIVAVFVWRLRRISSSARPVIAAVEALCLVFGLFISAFSLVYISLAIDDPLRFTQPMSKVSAVYFSVTVLATVGFGDIAPIGDLARAIVSVQMVLDLLLIGAAVKLLGMSARAGMQARGTQPDPAGQDDLVAAVAEAVVDPPAPVTGGAGTSHPSGE